MFWAEWLGHTLPLRNLFLWLALLAMWPLVPINQWITALKVHAKACSWPADTGRMRAEIEGYLIFNQKVLSLRMCRARMSEAMIIVAAGSRALALLSRSVLDQTRQKSGGCRRVSDPLLSDLLYCSWLHREPARPVRSIVRPNQSDPSRDHRGSDSVAVTLGDQLGESGPR